MKITRAIVAALFIFITSCQQETFNDKYTGTLVWSPTDGIPPDITCESNGNDCNKGLFFEDLAPGVKEWYQYVYNYLTPEGRTTADLDIDRNNFSVQVALFMYYKNKLNIKDYFKKENWQVLFRDVAQNTDLKYMIETGNFDILFVKNSDSMVFVRNAKAGYTVDNVLYAYKAPTNFFNTIY